MQVEQLYTGCLAEAAYYIESNGEAAIIDPLRETAPYLERAAKDGAKIKYIFETHFHADFVSGHLDLAAKTGATIVFGPTAAPQYPAHIAHDGEQFKLGNVTIELLHTPGHTMESSCFLLKDASGNDHAVFTGDTLFVGDVGRPDLAVKSDLSQEDLAAHLYNSLHQKLLSLHNQVIVYPGHGAGSACGKNMSKETISTIGQQRLSNYALLAPNKEAFVKEVLSGLNIPPQYFPKNAQLNKTGYQSIDAILLQGNKPLSPAAFEAAASETNAIILDVRPAHTFAQGFVPGAINIGLDGQFAPWVGALITDLKHPILLVTPLGLEQETIIRLARVGYDNTIGFLDGGFDAWGSAKMEVQRINRIDANQLPNFLNDNTYEVLDIRRKSEYDSEHIMGVRNFPLDFLNQNMASIKQQSHYVLHCAGGYRSMIMASILKARGFHYVLDVVGGFKAIKEAGNLPITDYVCPSTLL